jgi:uncharacterized protein (TIGR03435 family)
VTHVPKPTFMRLVAVSLLAMNVLSATAPLRAQVPDQPPASGDTLKFDVASVKPNKSDRSAMSTRFLPSGLYIGSNVPLVSLIMNAFSVKLRLQLIGGPDWLDSARFDIVAKTDISRPSAQQYDRMLQSLLRDRFNLALHTETRELPVYALVMGKRDGSLGPQIRRSQADCRSAKARQNIPRPQSSELPSCGMYFSSRQQVVGNAPLMVLVSNLAPYVDRIVVDRTGLNGQFDWNLRWEPDQSANTTGPSIFTALQEQLGLRLDAQRGSVQVLVIDHVEQPTAD